MHQRQPIQQRHVIPQRRAVHGVRQIPLRQCPDKRRRLAGLWHRLQYQIRLSTRIQQITYQRHCQRDPSCDLSNPIHRNPGRQLAPQLGTHVLTNRVIGEILERNRKQPGRVNRPPVKRSLAMCLHDRFGLEPHADDPDDPRTALAHRTPQVLLGPQDQLTGIQQHDHGPRSPAHLPQAMGKRVHQFLHPAQHEPVGLLRHLPLPASPDRVSHVVHYMADSDRTFCSRCRD